jgi:hypothetical protein
VTAKAIRDEVTVTAKAIRDEVTVTAKAIRDEATVTAKAIRREAKERVVGFPERGVGARRSAVVVRDSGRVSGEG